jgi:predicted phage terminase large subunit-like protein
MLEGTQVLWEEGQSYYHLMEIRLTEGPASFDSEYQNNPINPDDCLFQEEWFVYIEPDWENYTEFIGSCDPSMGKTAQSDYSAIIILGKHKDGFLDVLVADLERRHPDKIKDDILSTTSTLLQKHQHIPLRCFAIESVQFQEYFKDIIAKESRERGVYIPLVSTENQTTKKSLRIPTLQPLVKNGVVRFQRHHRLFMEQLKYYSPDGKLYPHDDGPDALEMAVRKARIPILQSVKY